MSEQDTTKQDDPPERREELLEAWKTCEDVAMHFNNLLMGFRLKAVSGLVVAVSAIFGLGLKDGAFAHPGRMAVALGLVAGVWILVWLVDFKYYYRLLAGAVDELLRLERALGNVRLSHLIERRVHGADPPSTVTSQENGDESAGDRSRTLDTELRTYEAKHTPKNPSWPFWWFYALPTLGLVILIWYSADAACSEEESNQKPRQHAQEAEPAPDREVTPLPSRDGKSRDVESTEPVPQRAFQTHETQGRAMRPIQYVLSSRAPE